MIDIKVKSILLEVLAVETIWYVTVYYLYKSLTTIRQFNKPLLLYRPLLITTRHLLYLTRQSPSGSDNNKFMKEQILEIRRYTDIIVKGTSTIALCHTQTCWCGNTAHSIVVDKPMVTVRLIWTLWL